MFHVHFIWAQSTSGIIGVNGKLPWQTGVTYSISRT